MVGSGTGAVIRRQLLGRVRGFPLRARVGVAVIPFPAPATSHVACGFPALRAPAHFTSRVMGPIRLERLPRSTVRYDTRYSEKSPSVPYSHSLLHRFQPKPRRWHARARWRRIFFSTQSRMYEKHRLEWPIAKYFTQPRRIGLIFSITSPTGWDRELRKISLSLPQQRRPLLAFRQ